MGSIDNNGGTFSPGASPALSTIDGSYTQVSGVLEIELGGTTAGTEFDRLEINGSASLGGELRFVLVDDFAPQIGDAFEFLTADGGVTESLIDIVLPALTNGMWQTIFGTTSAALVVTIKGDYNGNGVVDAADYTVWRDLLGQEVVAGTSADGDFDGVVTTADYSLWVSHFGQSVVFGAGSLGDSASVIPEPTAACLWLIGLAIATLRRRHFHRSKSRGFFAGVESTL
jgi:hypothetical protein